MLFRDFRRFEAGRRAVKLTVQHRIRGCQRRADVQRSGTIMLLGFADDIDIIGINRRAVEEASGPFRREAARIGLIINSTKTKYMVTGRERGCWC